ncbi:MAG TPA: hypothetical protein VJT16_08040 [Streptosporangiaceae bacterium]|jgi:hypothetical protein|nr:hypothetical protein [Streptosporangiaceae bacterium]
MAVILVLAVGGLAVYLVMTRHDEPAAHQQNHGSDGAPLSTRVRKAQSVGIIDVRPIRHPLKLLPSARGVGWVAIARSEIRAGVPVWTDNQMADGTDVFIYTATGKCLSAGNAAGTVRLAHCDLTLDQRWRPVYPGMAKGQPFAEYANAKTGGCLTAPGGPGPATLAACGKPRLPTQEITFWWNA